MTRITADTLALRFYVRLRDAADAYHRHLLTYEEHRLANAEIWAEAEGYGAPVVDRVYVLLLGTDIPRAIPQERRARWTAA